MLLLEEVGLYVTRFDFPCSAKPALPSERVSNDLRSALQVDGQMHMLMSWLMWSWKSGKPPSLKKEYKQDQIGLHDPALPTLPKPVSKDILQTAKQWPGLVTWTGITVSRWSNIHLCKGAGHRYLFSSQHLCSSLSSAFILCPWIKWRLKSSPENSGFRSNIFRKREFSHFLFAFPLIVCLTSDKHQLSQHSWWILKKCL